MLIELAFLVIVLAAVAWRQFKDNQVATGRKRRGQTQRQLIIAGALASIVLGYAVLQPIAPPVDAGPVTVSLVSVERELFGGNLVFNITANRDFTMPATSKAFYGSIDKFDRAGRLAATVNYTGGRNKWEFLSMKNVSGMVNLQYAGKPVTKCVPVQTNKTGDPTCVDETTTPQIDNYTFQYSYIPTWYPLTSLSGASMKKGESLIVRQRVEGGIEPFETVDVKPFIIDREYPEYALLISNATLEINTTVRNPTGHSISNATIHATYNQTLITGSSCGATDITFAWSDGTTQTALNTSLLNHYWLNFNGSNSFTAVIRVGTLPAWGGVLSAYCGTGGSGNSSAAYYAFGKEGQSGWMYGSRDGSTIVDLGPRGDNPDSSSNYGVISSVGMWGNYSINRTGTGNAYIENAPLLNTTDNLFTCRVKPWSVPTGGTDSMTWYDDGAGYFQYYGAGGNFGPLIYGANNTPLTAVSNFKLDSWQSLGAIIIGKGSATNENVTQVINGAVNGSINSNTAIVSSGKVGLGLKVSGLSWAARFVHDECGFIKGQNTNINEDWLRVFQNETLLSGNYTLNTGVDAVAPQYASNSTTPTNGSVFTGSNVTFNVSWTDNSALGTKSVFVDWLPQPLSASYYYALDEGTGSAIADKANYSATNGTINDTSGITWGGASSCKHGNCLNFSATSGVATAATLDFGSNNFTFSCWVLILGSSATGITTNNTNPSCARSTGALLYVSNASGTVGRPQFQVVLANGTTVTIGANSSSAAWYNEWNHLAGVYNNSKVSFYVNGVLSNSMVSATGYTSPFSTIYIGNRAALDRAMNGSVDEVQFFNRSLTLSEILALNATPSGQNFSVDNVSLALPAGYYEWYGWANDTSGNRNQTPTYGFSLLKADWMTAAYLNGSAANATLVQTTTTFLNLSNNTQATNVTGLALNVYLNGTLQSSSSSAFTNTTTWSGLTTGRTLNYVGNVTDTQNYSGTPVARSFTVHNITGYLRYSAPNTTSINVTNCSPTGIYTPQNQTSVYGTYNFSSNASANLATYWKVNATSSYYSLCISVNASGTGCTYLDTTPRRVYTGITPASTVSFWTFFNCSTSVAANSRKDFVIQMNTSLT